MNLLLAFVFVVLSNGFAVAAEPYANPRKLDAERAARQRQQSPVTPEVEAARSRLIQEYKTLLTDLFPNLNYIKVEFQPNVYGPEWGFLYGSHPFFTSYTFSIGPPGPAIQHWVAEHRAALAAAHINLVGVHSDLGSCHFETGAKPPL